MNLVLMVGSGFDLRGIFFKDANAMNPPPRPLTIQKIGDELAIAWDDGRESFLRLDFLRDRCPCAACKGEPDVMGNVIRPARTSNPGRTDLLEIEYVGGYAIQPKWGDGHRTGIYSWQYLRRLADEAEEA
jgi:DUF971 family protein